MALFKISDLLISLTLLINAFALISSKIIQQEGEGEILNRLKAFAYNVRKLSFFILFWNLFFVFLLAFVFPS